MGKDDKKDSQELTDKAKQVVERYRQLDFIKILESNELNQIDLNINKYNVNNKVHGASLLYWNVYLNNISIVKKLLELGANPNQKDSYGRIPLEIGAYFGFYQVCKILLESGADIDENCVQRAEHGWDGNKQVEILKLFEEWQSK
ncbi:ankyrin repeat domain-containing protein [Virgibacillus sp. C22-A2]|uniref:Ankyrin repeat domain-containing protein n=1 Tax=Virgibacillus tibetensis TaxID=3042313 RepID=A0ABU6KHD7_9BACI|nr:ankyrin repeat domain-containing protein [Virgibacillus sp. C22-A2]